MKSGIVLRGEHAYRAVLVVFLLVAKLLGQQGVSDTSLRLHFGFDEDFSDGRVRDLSGHENHGWQFNPTNWITSTNGVFGSKGAQFTTNFVMWDYSGHVYPASQYIGVTNLNGFEFLTNATISFWVQFDTNADLTITILGAGYTAHYTPRPGVVTNSWDIGRKFRPYLSFIVYAAGTTGLEVVRWPNDVIRSGGSNPNLGTMAMHLHTVTVDCVRDEVIAYYDGEPYMTNRIGVPWIRISGYPRPWLCIGAHPHAGTPEWGDDLYPNSGYHHGKLDDIRIYDRVLTPQEVRALYRGAGSEASVQSLIIERTPDGNVQLSWYGRRNVRYQVEHCSDMSNPVWGVYGLPIQGEDDMIRLGHRIDGRTQLYFRVYPLP